VNYINRVAIQQRLLVEFSDDPYNNILLRDLLFVFLFVFVTSGCHNNKVFRKVWKVVETKAGKTRVAKTKGREKEKERKERKKKPKKKRTMKVKNVVEE